MRVAITGANGFVGRYLGQYLDDRGKQSIGLLRRPVAGFPYDCRLIEAASNGADFEKAFSDCDAVVHLAAQAHVPPGNSSADFATIVESNVALVDTVVNAAIGAGVKKFVFISSVKVYGERTGAQPVRQDSTHCPADIYARSKHEAELRVLELTRNSDTKPTIIQPPLIYGHGVKGNLKSLLKIMRLGIPLPFASTDNRRDIVALPVICDLIDTCLDSDRSEYQTFLVSDGQSRSTADIIRLLGRIHKVRARLIPLPAALLRLMFRLPLLAASGTRLLGNFEIDISHTVDRLDWQPRVPDPDSMESDYP